MLKYRKGTGSLIASIGLCNIRVTVGFSVKQVLLYDQKQLYPALGNTSLPNRNDALMH